MILMPSQRRALEALPKSWRHPAWMPDVYVELLDLGLAEVRHRHDKKHWLVRTDAGRNALQETP